MRKIRILLINIVITFIAIHSACAKEYEISRLSNNNYAKCSPQISDDNISWYGYSSGSQILYYNESSIMVTTCSS